MVLSVMHLSASTRKKSLLILNPTDILSNLAFIILQIKLVSRFSEQRTGKSNPHFLNKYVANDSIREMKMEG